MKKTALSSLISFSLVLTSLSVPIFGSDFDTADKLRTEIRKLGTGPETRVRVKLKDGTKIEGFVAEANHAEFVVENIKTGVRTAVPYPAVKQVRGNNLSGKVKILIGVAAGIAFLIWAASQLE